MGAGMSSEEFVQAWITKATKNRLKGLDWDELQLNTLLVDPPRVRSVHAWCACMCLMLVLPLGTEAQPSRVHWGTAKRAVAHFQDHF